MSIKYHAAETSAKQPTNSNENKDSDSAANKSSSTAENTLDKYSYKRKPEGEKVNKRKTCC